MILAKVVLTTAMKLIGQLLNLVLGPSPSTTTANGHGQNRRSLPSDAAASGSAGQPRAGRTRAGGSGNPNSSNGINNNSELAVTTTTLQPEGLPDGYQLKTTDQGQIYFLHVPTGKELN